jgi:hypothetical protein
MKGGQASRADNADVDGDPVPSKSRRTTAPAEFS